MQKKQNLQCFTGYKVAQQTVSGDRSKGKGLDQQCTVDIKHDVVAAGKKVLPNQDVPEPLALQKNFMNPLWISDVQSKELLMLLQKKGQFTWDEVVVMVLHMVRCREFTKYDPKINLVVCTRFCLFNIAFFDLNKECEWIRQIIFFIHLPCLCLWSYFCLDLDPHLWP
jgi:hypothetical protein